MLLVLATLIALLAAFYGVARWYVAQQQSKPLAIGVTFIADYARALGLDAEETMDALIEDAGVERFRLVSYWNKIEQQPGKYDFNELDWQFEKAEQSGSEVHLAIGLRQPRWPECHAPKWVESLDVKEANNALDEFIEKVVTRYKDSPSLVSYQLENEYFLEAFGECPSPDRERLQTEYNLVKRLDATRPIVLSRSNNHPALLLSQPQPDIVGVSVYRKVWDGNFTNSYFTYPLPAWYYAGIAGLQHIATGKPSMLHEMQMEPWPANGQFVADASLQEQDKSFKAGEFQDRIDFAKRTGLRTIDLWGAEWWYWRMVEKNDPSFWNEAKEVFND